ncbi:hypothetical protein EV663_1293 [Rhodovulum bhavnagarense]|uniref:Uncharacterized protein n=2 Tax=Rhodovulum bhavnagarense TaxID=992286 RepID=A0A4R2R5X0_9RHOB|nr:hypothetical protein EV663_1293 [Rhodovulum bhavnagarense]
MQPAYDALFEIIMNHLNSRVGDNRYQEQIGFGFRLTQTHKNKS